MKRNIAIACNIASLILIISSINLGYEIMAFLFAGIVPWTNIVLTSTQMLALMTILTSIVITRIGILPLIKKYTVTSVVNTKRSKLTPKKLSRA